MKERGPRLVVIVPTATADLAQQAAAIARSVNAAARAVVELVDGQDRARVEFPTQTEAEAYVKALPTLFRAFQPVHPDDMLEMLGCEVVATSGGNHFAQQPVYHDWLERIDGPFVYVSRRRVRADQIIELQAAAQSE